MIIDKIPKLKNVAKTDYERELELSVIKFSNDVNLFSKIIFKPNIKTITASYTASLENILLVDCTSGHVTISLQNANRTRQQMYWIKKIDNSANNMIILPEGTSLIDGAGNFTTNTQYDGRCIVTDLINWYIIGDF